MQLNMNQSERALSCTRSDRGRLGTFIRGAKHW